MAEHLRHCPRHHPALALVEVGQRYAEESREPLPGDLHMVTLLRAYYLAVDPNRSAGGKLGGFSSFDRIQFGDPFWVIVY